MESSQIKVEPLTLHVIEPVCAEVGHEVVDKKDPKPLNETRSEGGNGEPDELDPDEPDSDKDDDSPGIHQDVKSFSFLASDSEWSSLADADKPSDKARKEPTKKSVIRRKHDKNDKGDEQSSNQSLNVKHLVECSECGGVFLNRVFLEKHLQKCLVNSDSEDGDDAVEQEDVVEVEEDFNGGDLDFDSEWNEDDDDKVDGRNQEEQWSFSSGSKKRKLHVTAPSRGHSTPVRRDGIADNQQPAADTSVPSWTWKDTHPGGDYKPMDIPFQGSEGLRNPITHPGEPISYFDLYFTEDVIEKIYKQTNKYACQYISRYIATLKLHSEVHQWKPTDAAEMKTFLGLCILMGLIHKPRISLYWSKDELYNTPIFGQIMSRTRFQLILKFLHFEDNEDEQYDPQDPKRDRLFKVRSIISMLKQRFSAVYNPLENITIEQSEVRLNPSYGIKLYVLSTVDGVVLDLIVYQDNMESVLMKVPGHQWLHTERLALTIMDPYLDKGHTLLTDSLCTTPRIAEYLLTRSTKLVGIARRDLASFPKNFSSDVDMEKGTSEFKARTNVLAIKYRATKDSNDKKPKVLHMLSTKHSANMQKTTKKDGMGKAIQKPEALVYYNQNICKSDKLEQQLGATKVLRRSFKWYHKIFFRLLMMSLFSGHKLYKLSGGKSDFLQFLHDVVLGLVANSPRLKGNSEHSPNDNLIRLSARHFPAQIPYQGNARGKKHCSKMCRVCYARGKRSERGSSLKTVWLCLDCPGQPGLCAGDCFKAFHTQFDYSQ